MSSLRKTAAGAFRTAVLAANRNAGRFTNAIWLVGEGRSGTTWVSNLINAEGCYLERFEPFHPIYAPVFKNYRYHEYRPPGASDPVLEDAIKGVFEGRYQNSVVDGGNRRLIYDGMIVKDVFASLLFTWAMEKLPGVKPVLLIRNPFAVARSKRERSDWNWPTSPAYLLEDAALVRDHLADKVKLIRSIDAKDDALIKHLALWAIVHYVAFRQADPARTHVLFYEDAVVAPEREIVRLSAFVGPSMPLGSNVARRAAEKASKVSSEKDVERARADPYDDWRRGLSDAELARGLEILTAFGLGGIYGPDGRPSHAAAAALMEKAGQAGAPVTYLCGGSRLA